MQNVVGMQVSKQSQADFWHSDAQEKTRYKLEDARAYHYLNQSSCIELNGVDNAEEYERTRHAMDVVGIKVEDQVSYAY